ncbi:MAG: 50S ribosomal protein L14e [Candidatus Altiarchaeota archaeon]|nr:50S ribosomal protein L14e [Candidatus Altiarchaeota archaeon]
MALLDVGRVCRKTSGKDAGTFCIITGKDKDNFIVAGADDKPQKISWKHLEPTHIVASGKDAAKELKKHKLI